MMKYMLLLTLSILHCARGFAQPLITPGYLFNSDPTAHVIDGRYWLFTTHDQATVNFQGPEDFWHNMMDFQAYSTPDLKHWTHHGTILNVADITWTEDFALWDGDAGIYANGKYYAYVSARIGKGFAIGVMVADKPQGPYEDVLKGPLITTETIVSNGLRWDMKKMDNVTSPTVVYDDKNNPWLLFGQFGLYIVQLKPNMIEFAGKIRELDIPYMIGEATEYIEGPMINKLNGKYYFSYMTYKDWDADNPSFADSDPLGPYIRYCIADSLTGPYRNPRNLIYPVDPGDCNYAHFILPFQDRLVMAYHVPFLKKQHRQVAITELIVNPDGSLKPVYPDKDPGIFPCKEMSLVLDAYAYKREAEEFHERKDAIEERGSRQDYHLKMKNNGYLLFRNVDFQNGAKSFKIAVSCENSKISDASVEFRLDSPTGKLIGTAKVTFTYWITYYSMLTGDVTGAEGVHDLYIVAKGEQGDAYGRLFNINWFTFSR